jgi:hypothetical protein
MHHIGVPMSRILGLYYSSHDHVELMARVIGAEALV